MTRFFVGDEDFYYVTGGVMNGNGDSVVLSPQKLWHAIEELLMSSR